MLVRRMGMRSGRRLRSGKISVSRFHCIERGAEGVPKEGMFSFKIKCGSFSVCQCFYSRASKTNKPALS